MKRCAHCGAANPPAAAWCGQCHERFEDTADAAGATSRAAGASDGAADGRRPRAARPQGAATGQDLRAAFRASDGRLEWTCPVCERPNTLEASSCAACGTSFAARLRGEEPEAPPAGGAALALSALLPGAGHLLVGQTGTGLARGILFLLWLGGGIAMALAGAGVAAWAPLLVGALVLWGGSLADLLLGGRPGGALLGGRTLLWLVVAVTTLLLLGLVASTLGAG